MGFFDRFRRRSAISDAVALGAFIDEQAYWLAEACVRRYSRLRAGDCADALFADAAFAAILDKTRWDAYPRALAMVAETAEAMLRPHAGAGARVVLEHLTALVLEAFDRRAVPAAIGDVDWRAARAGIIRSLSDIAECRPQPVEAIADAQASYFLAIMPLHEKLSGDDYPALRSQLRALLLQVQETLTERAELLALAAQLAAQPQDAPATAP